MAGTSLYYRAWQLLIPGFVFIAVFFVPVLLLNAQQGIDIAKRYPLGGAFSYGDIVVYDRDTLVYRLSYKEEDADVVGVTVETPTFLLDDGTSNVPVIKTGEALVNVVALDAPIVPGDYLTTSSVIGKAKRARPEDTFLLGIALSSYSGLPEEVVGDEGGVPYGRVPVLLAVGHVSKVQEIISAEPQGTEGVTEATILNVIQYIVAGFIAVGSVYIAFRNFGPNLKEGVLSIGRNPLARTSIQSMVALNIVLIGLISVGGLFVSLAILLLPI